MSIVTWDDNKPHFKGQEPSRYQRKAEKKAAEEAHERQVNAIVDARDHRTCRACGKASRLEAVGLLERGHRAHIVYRSAHGPYESWNLVTLCADCHLKEDHGKRLMFTNATGPSEPVNADGPLIFWRRHAIDQPWFIAREEIALGVVRKD